MALWILACIVSIILLCFQIVKYLNYWKYQCVPQYHFLITIREALLAMVSYRGTLENVKKIYKDFPNSRYVGIYQFFKIGLVVRDLDLIKRISVTDFDHFVDRFQISTANNATIWEKTLASLRGDEWREMRTTLTPLFTSSKLKVMFNLISEYSKKFVAHFEEQTSETISVEMKDVCSRFTNDIIASTAFGVDCDSMRNPNNEFYTMGIALTTFTGLLKNFKLLVVITLPKIAKILKIEVFPKSAISFFNKLIKESMGSREKCENERQDLIHLLRQASNERSKYCKTLDAPLVKEVGSTTQKEKNLRKDQLTDDSIISQAFVFFLAGFDTVSTLMCFTMYELALHIDIQERLQTEIDETLAECDHNLTYGALSKMRYLDMVVAEALRKWPSILLSDRTCTKPYTIQPVKKDEKPVHLRKGDLVWMPMFGIHRDPQMYPDPERFDPERFNEENKKTIPAYSYNPFGNGPRTCIGSRFALMETKLILFYILSKFHVTVTNETPIPLKFEKNILQLKAKGGFWLGLKRRN